MRDMRSMGEFAGPALEKLSELALERANVELTVELVTGGNWTNAVNLAIAGGEVVDLIHMGWNNNVAGMYAAGQLQPITEYLQQYAPQTLALTAEYIGCYRYNGELYGVPTLRNYSKNGYIVMKKSILDELGLTEKARNLSSFSEFEEIMQAVKDNYTDIYAFGGSSGLWSDGYISNGDNWADYDVYDNLGDTLSMIYCKDDVVSINVDIPHFEAECAMVADWFQKGYVWPDSIITTENYDDLIKNGVIFSLSFGSEHGVEVTKAAAYGFDIVCAQMNTGMVKTNQPVSHGIGVPVTSEDPEAACRVIELLYTDGEAMDLLIWGLEGTDYEIVDGQAKHKEDNRYMNADFLIGNNLLLTPLYGNGSDFYEQVAEINATSVKSRYLGFAFDSTDTDLVRSQITAVNDQYRKALVAGGYTPEDYAAYKDKLESAGIREYQQLFQTQLDAWLANK